MFIYVVRNRVNDKVYIGKSVKPVHLRWNRHLRDMASGAKCVLYSAMRKHGTDSFYVETLSEHPSHSELEAAEKEAIRSFKSRIPGGYNMTLGGDGGGGWNKGKPAPHMIGNTYALGHKHTEEARRKIGRAALGNSFAAGKPAHNRNSISVPCLICGKEMLVMKCKLKRKKCCSWSCRSRWLSITKNGAVQYADVTFPRLLALQAN